jgi:OOP family OmpA-OmpF porin
MNGPPEKRYITVLVPPPFWNLGAAIDVLMPERQLRSVFRVPHSQETISMRRIIASFALAAAAAMPLAAQQSHLPIEVGIFGQFTKYADVTKLDNAVGIGGLASMPLWRRIELQYEADYAATKSARVGDLTALNHRIDAVYHLPIRNGHTFFVGGGWTGSQYKSDTTKNQYDSGGNATIGVRWCVNKDWNVRTSGVMDFKDPSDQVPTGDRTQTLGLRIGVSRFFGAKGGSTPCVVAKPAPAPVAPPVVTPAPAPAPAPAKVEPKPEPVAPAPTPAPAPAPKPREIFRMTGVYFAFDKSALTQAGKDTLEAAVKYLNANPGSKVEIQGHTDNIGTDEYNRSLSDRRATAVMKYLRSRGIDASRMSTKGFGESQPAATNDTKEGRAQNRRVVIVEL